MGALILTLIWKCGIVTYRNKARRRGYCQAFITTHKEDEDSATRGKGEKSVSRKMSSRSSVFLHVGVVGFLSTAYYCFDLLGDTVNDLEADFTIMASVGFSLKRGL